MKRPRKLQSAQEKAKHRNAQLPLLKPGSVHPVPDQPPKPAEPAQEVKQPPQKSRKSRMIALRVESMTRRLVASMRDCPGASFETHADACGLGLSTFYEWMGRGEEQPKSCYAKFRAAMVKAMAEGEKVLHRAAMKTHAIHLLARRFPSHYPSEKAIMEISGKDGLPLIPPEANSFRVLLELHPNSAPLPDKPFVIEHVGGEKNGQREIWPPPQPNGKEPPLP
jgi:hypothetical protein